MCQYRPVEIRDHVNSGDLAEVGRLGYRCLYLLSRLHGPFLSLFTERGEAVFHAEVTKQIALSGFVLFCFV